MGMDVYGKNAKTEKGEYFRNNVWWWRPLASFIEDTYDVAANCEDWHSNSGFGLDEEDSVELAMLLQRDINNGVVSSYEKKYNEYIASLPLNDCNYCDGTGVRTDEVGVEMGMPTKELDSTIAVVVGRTHGTCNACRGLGRNESFEASYPFTTENVMEFASFLKDSGGFSIC